MNTIKYSCIRCKDAFTTNAFSKHEKRCSVKGNSFVAGIKCTSVECRYCHKVYKSINGCSQHEIQCTDNSNKIIRRTNYSWNKGQTLNSDVRLKKMSIKMANKYANNEIEIKGCFAWNTEERSKAAKQQGCGGYKEKAGRSKKFKVLDSFGNWTVLQSTYELNCSEILFELGINWLRPNHLKYDDRKYFADFYLPDFDIWLDTKNDYLALIDREKIEKVIIQNKVKLFVLRKEQITKDYITRLVQ